MRKSKGGTSLRRIQWPETPVPTHSPALGAGVKN
ncbi:mCG1036264 [Mus musculus]|nr:mCG1036264 [Mus musculus]